MKSIISIFIALCCLALYIGCSTNASNDNSKFNALFGTDDLPEIELYGGDQDNPEKPPYLINKEDSMNFFDYYGERVEPPAFNFDIDVSNLSLERCRHLRNEMFARGGYLFGDATLRAYFDTFDWYQPLFWRTVRVKLTAREMDFIRKIQQREQELLKKNYITVENQKVANFENVANFSQFSTIPASVREQLSHQGFSIVTTEHEQLFHLYEQNDYQIMPNFVTTDLYLQLLHMYFNFTIRNLEEEHFIPVLKSQLKTLVSESQKLANTASGDAKKTAQYAEAFYAIPLQILTDQTPSISSSAKSILSTEVANINQHSLEAKSPLANKKLNYSLYKPRGHYTQSENLKRYFKAMIWLQSFPADSSAMVFTAHLFQKNPDLMAQYMTIYEPTSFIVGESDNVSMMDTKAELDKGGYASSAEQLLNGKNVQEIVTKLKALNKERLKVKTADEETAARYDKFLINYMPQRYLFDNEILSRLTHIKRPEPKRTFPKGLDVFAALGNKSAENILLKEYKETQQWRDYDDTLRVLQKQFSAFDEWNNTVYNKWMNGLNEMCDTQNDYPYFMQTDAWGRKNLNTALASWAELKHDVILYAEQPMGAECGGWGPEPPVLKGYVEPNIAFWQNCIELLDLTAKGLKKHELFKGRLADKNQEIKEMASFLLSASEKELKGIKLSDQEYETIRVLGSTVEYLTLDIMDVGMGAEWSNVKGPDRMIAVVADVYSYNDMAMEVAVGYGDEIYVVVDIAGLLYLARGAVFHYHEFQQPASNRLTDEEWQKMLKGGKAPETQMWMKDIRVGGKKPEIQPNYVYSSGC